MANLLVKILLSAMTTIAPCGGLPAKRLACQRTGWHLQKPVLKWLLRCISDILLEEQPA